MSTTFLPAASRWYRSAQYLLVAVALVTTGAIVMLVLQTSTLLGQLTTNVAIAQHRASNLTNTQREALRLARAVTDLDDHPDLAPVEIHRGFLNRQLEVSAASFPTGSPENDELKSLLAETSALDWRGAGGHSAAGARRRDALVERTGRIEVRVRHLYIEQEKLFYATTIDALDAKHGSQDAQIGLLALVGLLVLVWAATLKRRTRTDTSRAYKALVAEMHERQVAQEALLTSEERFRSLVQAASDLTALTDADGTVTYISPVVEAMLGYRPAELSGQALTSYVHEDDRVAIEQMLADLIGRPGGSATMELRLRGRDGRWRYVEAVCRNLLADPAVAGIVWNGRDVTDRRALQDELTRQAFHDPLTGLPNRTLFLNRLKSALTATSDRAIDASVILIDLDGFKHVNDTLGHPAGDELLRLVSARLARCIRSDDTPARLGGDEFAIVVSDGGPEAAAEVADRILMSLHRPFRLGGAEVAVGGSIGIAHGDAGTIGADLLRDADIAMYVAKSAGKNRVEMFRQEMRDRTTERSALQRELLRAVEQDEITVHFQPIVDLHTGAVLAVEALARWRHPSRGLLLPDMFIPLAEECGAISDIGRRVLESAVAAASGWRATVPGCGSLLVTVNVSGRQVQSGDLVATVVRALDKSGLEPGALVLEITESVLIEDTDNALQQFQHLKNLGVRIAVDDFGAGYSSLGSLTRFPIDILKIDRTLLELDTTNDSALVRAVSDLGRTLGLTVVAEGTSTADHLLRARQAGCHAAQGFFLARPLPADEVGLLLQRSAATGDLAALVAA